MGTSFACWPRSLESEVASADAVAVGRISRLIAVRRLDESSCRFPTSLYLFDVDRYLMGSGPAQILVYGRQGYTERGDEHIVVVDDGWEAARPIAYSADDVERFMGSRVKVERSDGFSYVILGISLMVAGSFLGVGGKAFSWPRRAAK